MCWDCVKGEAHMHFLVAASLVSAPRRVDSSLNRWLVLKQLHQASIYLRPAPEWNSPGTLTHRARIEEQSFSCSTLRNELILQQATAARANLTARSLHLRLPGLEKGRPWCFLLLAASSSCTHSLTHSHVETRRRSGGGGGLRRVKQLPLTLWWEAANESHGGMERETSH